MQLLWHQLRVSVLVLKERLLQGLQDSNGNYTRQTDILQAFSQDQHQVGPQSFFPSCPWVIADRQPPGRESDRVRFKTTGRRRLFLSPRLGWTP